MTPAGMYTQYTRASLTWAFQILLCKNAISAALYPSKTAFCKVRKEIFTLQLQRSQMVFFSSHQQKIKQPRNALQLRDEIRYLFIIYYI